MAFVCYALQGFVDGLREQCAYVGRVQLGIAWEHLVYETFNAEPSTAANARRRTLVLALGAAERSVPESGIPDLTSALARSYATRTEKTLTRDLNWLRDRELVLRTALGYRARALGKDQLNERCLKPLSSVGGPQGYSRTVSGVCHQPFQ